MSTYTMHPQQGRHAAGWAERHPAAATITALAATVLAGVLIGLMLGTPPAGTTAQHRGGGTPAVSTEAAPVAAPAATVETTVIGSRTSGARSPARGGFAVGRTEGASTRFIAVDAGTRAPARGGFTGRSLGAGEIPATGVADAAG
jgi:hypothetical protein